MGVAGFTSFLKRRYPEAFVSQQGATVDHLYLDLSSTLHQILRKGKSVFYMCAGWCVADSLDEAWACMQPICPRLPFHASLI